MSLALPADLETFATDFDQMTSPGVYALDLYRPENPAEEWDRQFDVRPDWWESFVDASSVVYVGASKSVLTRLEEHRNAEVRRASILKVCDIAGLRGVWWFDDADRAFERESGIAISIQNACPSTYVHQR